jgi:hypothetical protein
LLLRGALSGNVPAMPEAFPCCVWQIEYQYIGYVLALYLSQKSHTGSAVGATPTLCDEVTTPLSFILYNVLHCGAVLKAANRMHPILTQGPLDQNKQRGGRVHTCSSSFHPTRVSRDLCSAAGTVGQAWEYLVPDAMLCLNASRHLYR